MKKIVAGIFSLLLTMGFACRTHVSAVEPAELLLQINRMMHACYRAGRMDVLNLIFDRMENMGISEFTCSCSVEGVKQFIENTLIKDEDFKNKVKLVIELCQELLRNNGIEVQEVLFADYALHESWEHCFLTTCERV